MAVYSRIVFMANGYFHIEVPDALVSEIGTLLPSLLNYIEARSLRHRIVEKPPGGHVTPWWLYVTLDPRHAWSSSEVQFGETTHDVVIETPHIWVHAKQKWMPFAATLLKRFMAWRVAIVLEEFDAVAMYNFDGAEYGTEYLSLTAGAAIVSIPPPPRTRPEGWAYGFSNGLYGWYPPHYAKVRRSENTAVM